MKTYLNKRKTFSFFILACVLLFSSLTPEFRSLAFVAGKPEQRRAGVKAGDWAKYGDIKVKWNSSDQKARPEPGLINVNLTAWFKLEVLSVKDTTIRFRNTTVFKNNTKIKSTDYVDVYDGRGKSLTFIAADLDEGEIIYFTELEEPFFINQTISRTYMGVKREVNHLNLTYSYSSPANPSQTITVSLNYYWDKTTGILTERRGTFINRSENYVTSWSRSDKLIETNLWSSSENSQVTTRGFNPWTTIAVLMVLLILGIVLLKLKKARSKVRRRLRRKMASRKPQNL
jgi:hypothetical protein